MKVVTKCRQVFTRTRVHIARLAHGRVRRTRRAAVRRRRRYRQCTRLCAAAACHRARRPRSPGARHAIDWRIQEL